VDGDIVVKIERLICNLAYFYKGSASFQWLESQPIPKLLLIQEEAIKIAKQIKSNSVG
jgi:hypothetical protein